MSGNVTKDGIKADLEWMKRAGIGGFQNFDAGLNTPQIVEKRLVYMTPEWKDAFKYATTLADQLGLEMAIAGSPGWSESGGPWVTPAQAMKKYVWSETRVDGGRPFTGVLPKPPSATGPYQNQVGGRGGAGGQAASQPPPPEFYADAAVVAYRAPDSDRPMSAASAKVTSSGGAFDVAALTDGDLAKATLLPAAPVNERAWIQYEFPQAQTVRGLTFITSGGGGGRGGGGVVTTQLEVSDDGSQFRTVTPIAGGARTIAFAPVTGRVFRISILTPPPQQNPARGGAGGFGGGQGGGRAQAPAAPAGTQIAEFLLHGAVVNRFQEKAAFSAATNIYAMATPAVPAADAIRKADVIDLTSKMRADGTLDWTPPAGRWVVLRFGYSLTGQQNSPASPEATGLEVDKLNKGYVKAYFDNYLDQYKDATGGLMGKRGLQYVITDSWEAGVANWTDDMIAEFAKRRGYDMKPWLPALAGRIVESAEASDRFLWDFRKTLTDLVAEYHYDQLTDLLAARGMARYTESHENGRAFIADGMEVKARAAVPMSAMWTAQANRPSSQFDADIRESASVAHIYGQNLVAAESLTAGSGAWSFSPETLKPTADRELAMGLNRFVIHTSVHQPVNDKIPGLGLGPFGQWFTRHETWAEQAKAWTTYLARSSYLLQQGKFVGRHRLLLRRGLQRHRPVPGQPAADSGRLQLRLRELRRGEEPPDRLSRRPAHHGDRDELPRPGARPEQPAHAARCAPQDPRHGERGRRHRRSQADRIAQPVGRCGRLQDDRRPTVGRHHWQGQGPDRQHRRRPRVAEGRSRLRVHEAAGRHRAGLRAPQAGRRRRVLGEPPERPGRGCGGHLPRPGQGAGALARRDGRGRARVLPDGRGPHHRVADPAAERRRVRGLPQGGHGAVAHHRQAGGNEAHRRGGFLGRGVPAEPRRARQGHAARARLLARARRSRREVLLRHRAPTPRPSRRRRTGSRPARSCGSIWATSRTSPR